MVSGSSRLIDSHGGGDSETIIPVVVSLYSASRSRSRLFHGGRSYL